MKNTNSSSVLESKRFKNHYVILPYPDNKLKGTVNHEGYCIVIKGIM